MSKRVHHTGIAFYPCLGESSKEMLIKPLSMKLIPTDQITRMFLGISLIRSLILTEVVLTHKKIK